MRVLEEAEVTQALDTAIRDGLCASFPEERAVFAMTRQWHGSGPCYSVILEMGCIIVAHVGVVDRTVKAGDESVRVPELAKLYGDCGWQILPRERVVRIDEHGQEVELPSKNIAMYFPLTRSAFPSGPIHLQGNDW